MAKPFHLLTPSFAVLLILSGCSSDSGGTSQSALSGIPRPIASDEGSQTPSEPANTTPPASTTPPPGTGTPTDTDTPDNTEAPTTPSAPTAPATPETPAAPVGAPANANVNNLIGSVRFEFGFNNSSDVFTLDKTFAEADSGIDPASGQPFVQSGSGTTIVTRCTLLPNRIPYFCAEATALSSTTVTFRLFLFDLDASLTGSGSFEFCPAGTSVEVCVTALLIEPNGSVRVAVNANAATTEQPLDIRRQRITTDVHAHHLSAEQAQPSGTGAQADAEISALLTPTIEAMMPVLSSASRASLGMTADYR